MGHVNGFPRKKLNDRTPIQSFSATFGEDILERLKIPVIDPDQITLQPGILDK